MATEIEVTKVDEAAAQRLADATGRVVYLGTQSSTKWNFPARMTTDRDEAVGWGEFLAFPPQPQQSQYWHGLPPMVEVDPPQAWPWEKVSDAEPEPQLRVVRVLEYRGDRDAIERLLADSRVSMTEPAVGTFWRGREVGRYEIVEQIRTTERLCRWCGGEHLGVCSEEECSGNPRKGKY